MAKVLEFQTQEQRGWAAYARWRKRQMAADAAYRQQCAEQGIPPEPSSVPPEVLARATIPTVVPPVAPLRPGKLLDFATPPRED